MPAHREPSDRVFSRLASYHLRLVDRDDSPDCGSDGNGDGSDDGNCPKSTGLGNQNQSASLVPSTTTSPTGTAASTPLTSLKSTSASFTAPSASGITESGPTTSTTPQTLTASLISNTSTAPLSLSVDVTFSIEQPTSNATALSAPGQSTSSAATAPQSTDSDSLTSVAAVAVGTSAFLLFLLGVALLHWCYRQRKRERESWPPSLVEKRPIPSTQSTKFPGFTSTPPRRPPRPEIRLYARDRLPSGLPF